MTTTNYVYWDNMRVGGTYASVDPSIYTEPDPPHLIT
jgi:hypothetical protein